MGLIGGPLRNAAVECLSVRWPLRAAGLSELSVEEVRADARE
jgi:hypothetical protein